MNLTKNVEKKHHRNTCVFRNARLGDKTNKSKAEIVVKVWKAVGAGRRDCQLTRRGFLSEGYKPVSSVISECTFLLCGLLGVMLHFTINKV